MVILAYPSMYRNTLAYAAVSYQAFHYSISYLSRWRSEGALWLNPCRGFTLQYCLLIALTSLTGAGVKLPRHNEAHHLPVKRLGRLDRQLVSLLELSPVLKHTGSTPQIHALKPIFRRNMYKEYVLSRTRTETVSDTTRRSNL